MQEITITYDSDHRKHRYEIVDQPQKQPNIIFINTELAAKVIMDCRTTAAHKFRTKLGFREYVILTKEQSVLTKIMSSFEGENIQTQYNVLGQYWLIFPWL